LEKINQQRLATNDCVILEDYIIDYLQTSPVFFDQYFDGSHWHKNPINKGFFSARAGENQMKKSTAYINDRYLIGYFEFKGGNKIEGFLNKSNLIKMLYWYHCIGYCDHRLTIENDGTMKVINTNQVHKGFIEIENFQAYLDEVRDLLGL
jgi:hypothetical protein